jgi:hypothetical protein
LVRRLGAVFALVLLASCSKGEQRVDPADYRAFFLWAGVRPGPALAHADTIYLLDGEVRHRGPAAFVRLRPQVPRIRHAEVWLTVRAERLDWSEAVYRRVLADAARWEAQGNRLSGVQIDFDTATKGLGTYSAFLADLRRRLPARYRLSVTGLMDWSANGDPAELARLRGVVDEVVIQTYQGRRTIPGYAGYMAGLQHLAIPYRIALVEGGQWRAPEGLERDAEFRGYVVFLLP